MLIRQMARSGTTLAGEPPSMEPMLSVTPGIISLRVWSWSVILAAARRALRPAAKSRPAWAARPWMTTEKLPGAATAIDDRAVRERGLEEEPEVVRFGGGFEKCGWARGADLFVGIDQDLPPDAMGVGAFLERL
jgi:hypothetical protein